MKKCVLLRRAMVLFLATFAVASLTRGATMYVDDDNTTGPWDGSQEHPYLHIQDGVDNASSGDTVYVFSGSYYENVVVDKMIFLLGQEKENTIIEAGGEGSCVHITADQVEISRFTVRYSGGMCFDVAGIHVSSSSNTITQNVVTCNGQDGILIAQPNDPYPRLNENTISDNIVTNNSWTGIKMSANGGTDNIISNNVIKYNGLGGIHLEGDVNSMISSNTIENNQYGFTMTYPRTYYATITGNKISNNRHGIWQDPYGGGRIVDSRISHNTISGNSLQGIYMVALGDTISHNVITGNGAAGIALCNGAWGNAIGHNVIMNNGDAGISFDNVTRSQISGNYIAQNRYGIHLHHWARCNLICENTIANNGDYGIYITDAYDDSTYHNEVINNGLNAFQEDTNALNIWDDGYPSGGNYWDDYTGSDNFSGPQQDIPGSDGIGDIPYDITGGGQDRYPLMSRWTPSRGDANGDGQINVGDALYMLNYLFRHGPPPASFEAGDANCDYDHGALDVVFLLNYLFRSGPAPGCS